MLATETSVEVRARRSACPPPGLGKVVILLLVSFGVPGVVQPTPDTKSQSLRKKLCSVADPDTGGRVLPSLSRLQTPPPVLPLKPTASNLLTVERLLTSAVEKMATL